MSIFDGKLNIEAASESGVEAVTKRELVRLGYSPGGAVMGRITFEGSFRDVARANMFLRTAERVRICLATFPATTFDELFDGVASVRWKDILTSSSRVVVNAKSYESKLFALSSVQSVAHKAIMTAMQRDFGVLTADGGVYDVEVYIYRDVVTLKLDATGVALHKRGYRTYLGKAPIKETLASAMIQLSVWNADRPLLDPFCGSGTILIEAASYALSIAPGMRRNFAFEGFENAPNVRQSVQEEAEDLIRRDLRLDIFGCDIDADAIRLAKKHAERAGVSENIKLAVMDMRDVRMGGARGVVVTNPPYGERMMGLKELKTLYADFGKMCASLDDWCVYVITSFKGFEKYFGKRADKIRRLYNSELECNYYRFLAVKQTK